MKQQQGFTLIELVIVIVILGILAAVAVPKFVDLSSEAEEAALAGVVGALQSASSINFAAYKASKGAKGTAVTGDNAAVCTTGVVALLMQGGWPGGYTIEAGTTAATADAAHCKITSVADTSKSQDDVQVLLTN